MSSKAIKFVTSMVFAFCCLIAFNKNAWAYGVYQTGNSDTSVTVNWEGTDTTTEYKLGYAEVPVNADYSSKSTIMEKAKTNAANGQIVVPKGTYSYTITGLKAQTEYYVYLYYTSGTYSTYEYYSYLPTYTKIKKVNNVAQSKWWKYIEKVDVSWDAVPSEYSSDISYEVVFMDAKGKTIEKKTVTYGTSYSHPIKNNKIYTVKVRAKRNANSTYTRGMTTETTAWSDVQYLFTQPTIKYAKLANKKLKIKWNKISGVTSYDVYVSTKQRSGYKKVKTLKAKKSSYVIKKFNKKKLKKKKYFVYVVPNKKVKGKVIKKDVTYVYEVKKGSSYVTECYK